MLDALLLMLAVAATALVALVLFMGAVVYAGRAFGWVRSVARAWLLGARALVQRRTLEIFIVPFLVVGALVYGEDRVQQTRENSTVAISAFITFIDGGSGGCTFQATGRAVRDAGTGTEFVFGESPTITVVSANATCAQLANIATKCAKFGMGLDGGGCP